MQRRHFISLLGSASGAALLTQHAPGWAQAVREAQRTVASTADRILILIELKGGNDGLNTVIPYADPAYAQFRSTLAIPRDSVLALDARTGLHPELKSLMPLWEKRELAIVQGVGYPQPNLSHFRSIEIWATSSRSDEYLDTGWVGRAMKAGVGDKAAYTAEGVLIGGAEFGVLAGARAVSLNNPESFLQNARFAAPREMQGNAALQHLLRVEGDVLSAAAGLRADKFDFKTEFPAGAFGNSVRAVAQVVASQRGRAGVPVITLSLGSFDTHQNQLNPHANLLRQLADGIAALRGALTELDAWDRTLVMTFSEFGRRARQNQSQGTDHGTAAPHVVAGGAVRGGLYGQPPDFSRLDGAQNLLYTTDFRQLYGTIAKDWWGIAADKVVRGRFDPLSFIAT